MTNAIATAARSIGRRERMIARTSYASHAAKIESDGDAQDDVRTFVVTDRNHEIHK